MPQGQLSPVVGYLRKISACQPDERADEQLLEIFCRDRDERAFAELLRRHAGMVLAVCRRVLHNLHDAEDAFQATFLVFARRAAAIRKRACLASWLHGVAYRVAMKAKVQTARRHVRQLPLQETAMVQTTPDFLWQDLRPVLDEEIDRLPKKYRQPFVLCYLEGKTNEEAARLLGCARGTIFSRLAWARRRLSKRLTRRGIVLSLTALNLCLAHQATAAGVPAPLMQTTIQAAILANAGKFAVSGLASEQAVSLAKGVMRTMLLTRLKTFGTLLMAVILVGVGAGLLGFRFAAAEGAASSAAVVLAEPAPPKNALDDKVRKAIDRGVEYLKNSQKNGNWERTPASQLIRGGTSALALLGLLESGVKVDDPVMKEGLDYLRDIEPIQTYVISLQTLVFSHAKRPQDKERIQRNVDWLLAARCRDPNGPLLGWTYTKSHSRLTDNSNTQFAVMALDAAQRAGATVLKRDWEEIRDLYLRTQQADGGWVYNPALQGQSTFTMTSAGVCGLLISRDQLKERNEKTDKAIAYGLEFLGNNFSARRGYQYYRLHDLGRVGRLSKTRKLDSKSAGKSYDWYELEAEWLLDHQREDGSWDEGRGLESSPTVSTSFALLFLNSGKKTK
jgi:RNA polymerase sigma factor (sigma-70 family)